MTSLTSFLTPELVIQDAIHGRIWLTALERDLVNTRPFQRLRAISQLGGAAYVFPTATHSRFAHSLGATHVMGMMLEQRALHDYFARSDKLDMIPLLRLAALLHDIGHFPFSHLGENVWAEAAQLNEWYPEGTTVFDIAAQASRPFGGNAMSHEALTEKLVLESEIAGIIDSRLPKFHGRSPSEVVVAIINGSDTDLVARSLISSDLDCDRLDYLIRDSSAAGLDYGQVDLAYLIENLVIAEHPNAGCVVAVNKRHGGQAVQHYLLARYFHYAQFITHKTTAAAELLLGAAMLELLKLGQLPKPGELEKLVLTPGFAGLTDARIWARLYECDSASWAKGETVLREVAERLLRRDLLKCAIDLAQLERHDHLDPLDELETPEGRARLASEAGLTPDVFAYKRSSLPLVGVSTKLTLEPVAEGLSLPPNAWVKTVKLANPGDEPELLIDQEGLVQYLSQHHWVTRRIFVREDAEAPKGKRARLAAVRHAVATMYSSRS